MDIFITLIMLAVLTETIWGRFKEIIPDTCPDKIRKVVNLIGTSILGVLIALLTGVDIFELLGYAEKLPILGGILTGLLVGGGSNYVHDLTRKLRNENTAIDGIVIDSPEE